MNSAISGYSVKCSFFSAAPLGTALAEYQYSPSAATSTGHKSKHSGLSRRHSAGNLFVCSYSLQSTNVTYNMSKDVLFRISQAGRHQVSGTVPGEMTDIIHGITRCIPAGKFY